MIVYDGDNNQIHKLGPDSPLSPPVVGEIAFFVGCPQPFSAKVAPRGDAQLLVLSRESYLKMKGAFPDQHGVILHNICSKFGLNTKVRRVILLRLLKYGAYNPLRASGRTVYTYSCARTSPQRVVKMAPTNSRGSL